MKTRLLIFLIFLLQAIMAGENIIAQENSRPPQDIFRQEQKVESGYSISVRNAFGNISITGWESDLVKISAVNELDQKPVRARIIEDNSQGRKVLVVVVPQVEYSGNGVVSLQVMVPRQAQLQPVRTKNGSVTASNIEGFFSIETGDGNIKINDAGSIEIHTTRGQITAKKVKGSFTAKSDEGEVELTSIGGRVDLVIGKGRVSARDIEGDISLMSVDSPRISLQCVLGHVEINDTDSFIDLAGIADDVYVMSSTGEVQFRGEIKAGKHYRLKSLSGFVSMFVPESSSFFASLRTYKGEIKSDFTLQNSLSSADSNRQIQGIYGNGQQARIELDSFSGAARLRKLTKDVIKKCDE